MLSDSALVEQIQKLVAEALQVTAGQIAPELEFGGIKEWDSMGHMGVMMLLEERYGIPIDADLIASLTSVPLICEYVRKNPPENKEPQSK
jgi:citrate synthase